MSYLTNKPTNEELVKWSKNKLINPRSGRKITQTGKIYKILEKSLKNTNMPKLVEIIDTYRDFRDKNIDPILLEELPVEGYENKKYFKFKFKWNPYTGERGEIDTNGYLAFDPDTLIHFFYSNRTNYLWETSNNDYTGYYGDAVGNGPNFEIIGRGKHPDWNLFRLPIVDCYLIKDHCYQSVTMGPLLEEREIKEIDKLAKKYKSNYKNKFNMKRPSLHKLYQLYQEAINPNPDIGIPDNVIPFVDENFVKIKKHNANVDAVKKLIKM